MKLTRHAQARMQQRGISWEDIDYVLDNGRETHDHHGGCIYSLDRRSRQGVGQADRKNVYAVVADETIVTVGIRHRPVWRR